MQGLPAASLRMRWRALAALLAGLLAPCAFAPYGLWPLAPLTLVVLALAVEGSDKRRAALLGFIFGLGLFGHGVWWIQVSVHQFGVPYYVFSVGVTAAFVAGMALYTALFAALLRTVRTHGVPLPLALPALWTLVEMLRGWALTGFPWLAFGYSQVDGPLAGFAPLLGVYGCSAVVALQGGLLAALPRARWPSRGLLLVAVVGLAAAGIAAAGLRFTTAAADEVLEVALIQGAVPQALKWQREVRGPSIELYRSLSAPHWDADVVIWPETAIPAFPHEVPEVVEDLAEAARRSDTDLLIGMPTGEPWNGAYFNSLVDLGASPGRYDKRHLVPFGEFFPFKDALSGIAMLLDIPLSDFSAGPRRQSSLDVAGYRAGITICYEDVFGREVRDALPAAAFLVNISNDAWFGDSIAPHQHLEIARMRALESGRWLLRGTNTGITAIIDHRGAVRARAPQFVATSLRGTFEPRAGATPYVAFGDWPVAGAALLALAVSVAVARYRRRSGAAQ